MRIDDLNRSPQTQSAEKTDQAAPKRPSDKDSVRASAADEAQVSRLAQTLASADPQRLEQLRLDVQSGKYDVAADVVAKAIIDEHLKG
jgi:anti-sigma28 factor (negative regulator of flagellin synthesis)